jgi:2C-methyl-D-erythritol 2,4-cyclodiphosphate synthase
MASIRKIKKDLNRTVYELVDEAYNVQLENPKLSDKSEALIDQIADFHAEMLGKMHAATSKKDLAGFGSEVEQRGYDLFQEVMNLHV